MMWRRGLLRLAGDDPERGTALAGNRRDPSQRGNLFRDVQCRIAVARFLGQEENDVVHSVAGACNTVDRYRSKEIGEWGAPNAMSLTDKEILQRLCEGEIAADQGDHGWARRGR